MYKIRDHCSIIDGVIHHSNGRCCKGCKSPIKTRGPSKLDKVYSCGCNNGKKKNRCDFRGRHCGIVDGEYLHKREGGHCKSCTRKHETNVAIATSKKKK